VHEIINPDQVGEPLAVSQAVKALRAGLPVVLPTETLYALSAAADKQSAIDQLREMKGLTGFPGWVLHLDRPSSLTRWIQRPNRVLSRLVDKLWPGPLAVRVTLTEAEQRTMREALGPETYQQTVQPDGKVSFRCPDQSITRAVIEELTIPLVMIGVKAGDAGRELPSALADTHLPPLLAIDAGPGRYRGSSTLVEVSDSRWKVIRPGAIAERTIRRVMEQTIVFVCSGNTCRSPMAEQIGKILLGRKLGLPPEELELVGWNITSAGVHATAGAPATAEARSVIRSMGGSLERHRSRAATADLLLRADLVLTMTEGLKQELLDTLPNLAGKISRLDPDSDVIDPIGGPIEVYRQTAERIQQLVAKRLEDILA
jgi:tRNA A37 threonylcarbamoyladenosine synthetase subunit TsaC/SUA5/YrdC/protein-tyrosine-phosphatase